MDAGVITASTGFVGAVVALLGALGGAMAFLIRRADRKRETGEAMMVDHFKEQMRKAEQKNRWLNLALDIKTADGNAWREQLLRHDIEPEPDKWTAIPKLEDV